MPARNPAGSSESKVKFGSAMLMRGIRASCQLLEGSQQRLLALEGEQQQVDHPERVVVRTELRPEGRIAHDRVRAALHRALERLRDAPRADALELAVVDPGLAEDVEPQRRVAYD